MNDAFFKIDAPPIRGTDVIRLPIVSKTATEPYPSLRTK